MDSDTQQQALIQKAQDQTVEEDPGIIIQFAPKANIHRLLSLPAIANIPDLMQGVNEDDSFRILLAWLNSIVTKHGPGAAVLTLDGRPVPGLYHNMIKCQHSKIEGDISHSVELTADIVAHGVATHSGGQYFSIEGSGTGSCSIIHNLFVLKRYHCNCSVTLILCDKKLIMNI